MKKEVFEEIVKARIAKTTDLLITKAAEYADDIDRLHNFNRGSGISGECPAKVLDGMMLKHYISYRDMLDKLQRKETVLFKHFDEKIGDIIVYFILQEAVMLDSGLIK